MSNFWKSLDLLITNCEIELNLSWSRISEIPITTAVAANPNTNPPVQAREATVTAGATFQINNAKLSVQIVTLSINDIIKFLGNMKQGLKRTIS